MADGALVLVDAFEGPMPQTKFVLRKAFACHIRPIVVINKVDRPDARPNEVLNEVFDTFVELGASEEQLDFSYIFASGKAGFASHDPHATAGDVSPLFDLIVEQGARPGGRPGRPLLDALHHARLLRIRGPDRHRPDRLGQGQARAEGRAAEGRRGQSSPGRSTACWSSTSSAGSRSRRPKPATSWRSSGWPTVDIGDTIAAPERPIALPRIEVDEPTLSMLFTVNDSPLTGEGQYLTSRHLKDRLDRELESNVALRVEPTEDRDAFQVSGRGLLHLSVLIETMRREGYELAVGKPEVIVKQIGGVDHEPYEFLVVDVPHGQIGPVMELVGGRRGEMTKMDVKGAYAHLEFLIPARGLIGLRNRLMSGTQGEAIMHHNFHDYQPLEGRHPQPRQRRDGQHGPRPGGRLLAGQPPAARHHVRRSRATRSTRG